VNNINRRISWRSLGGIATAAGPVNVNLDRLNGMKALKGVKEVCRKVRSRDKDYIVFFAAMLPI
jgi:hypothetical protein